MPIVNRVADLQPDIQAWRRDIHQHPELLYDVHRTAAFVADRLREFGCDEVATGLGRTGVVGVIKGRKPVGSSDIKVIGLRADMDALPIEEATHLAYASKTPGKMHACGHDGHTAMLLGAARYLAETRNFAGDAVVIFEKANVVHMGDLVFNRIYPFVDRPGGASIRGWIKSLEDCSAAYPVDAVYIFGHGNPKFGVMGTRGDLLVMRDFLSGLLAHVSKEIAAGHDKPTIVALENLPGFPDYDAPLPNRLGSILGAAFDELTAPKA